MAVTEVLSTNADARDAKEATMQKDERDLLDVLKFELEFVEKGGYGRSPREPWRPQFIFEDSPTCMNYDCKENPGPCSDCVLMHWIPDERREDKAACRHIPLGRSGETLDSLYRYGDQQEIEGAVSTWLRATISQLEAQRKSGRQNRSEHSLPSGTLVKGTPLYQQLHPKCANPGCPAAFHWLGGGKFFRFRADQPADASPSNFHGVKHFWLCERCSHMFTLVHYEENGVVLRLLCAELPVEERKTLPAA
jgi:hypothetical protein